MKWALGLFILFAVACLWGAGSGLTVTAQAKINENSYHRQMLKAEKDQAKALKEIAATLKTIQRECR